ncbi:MAG: dihydropteroate synthase [Muribaculaceae bacterium]
MRKFEKFSINVGGKLLFIEQPWVMGILNVTPDSFYAESRCQSDESTAKRAEQMIAEGADIIDVGGYSSRPGADDVTPEEEFRRLSQGIEAVRKAAGDEYPISIDTFRESVARRCIDKYGALIINDISGGTLDEHMFSTVAELKVPYILMHMRGTPSTMQSLTQYDNLLADIITDLAFKASALTQMGASDIIIDPGFGFSKDIEQNYELMAHLDEFHALGLPILVGISRKSMIYKPLGITPADALAGTIALNTAAIMAGAHIIRVHDVAPAVQARDVATLITNAY